MKMPISRKILFRSAAALGILLMLAACGTTNKDETAPAFTYSGTDPSSTVRVHYLAGTVEPGATVTASVDTKAQVSTPTVENGTWSCTVSQLADGLNTVTVVGRDAVGNSRDLTIALEYDALTIETYVTPISGTSETIGGLVDPTAVTGAKPVVTVNGTALPDTAVMVNGDTWSADLSDLQSGDNTVSVSVTQPDIGEVTKTQTINVNAAAPTITIDPVASPTQNNLQIIGGSRTDSLAVTLTADSVTTVGVPTPPPSPTWNATLTGLDPGRNVVTAAVTSGGTTATARTLIVYAPQVRELPADHASDVAPGTTVQAFFQQSMDKATFTTNSFTLTGADGNTVPANVTYDDTTRVATLTPSDPLAADTQYTATLTTAITDNQGNPLPQEVTWSFTTVKSP